MAAATGLLARLAKYATSDRVSPLENLTTELLAWMANADPGFAAELVALLSEGELKPAGTVPAETQVAIPRGFVDLCISTTNGAGRTVTLLVENKIDAGIGVRAGPPPAVGTRPPPQPRLGSYTQVDTYLEYAASQGSPYRVVLLTKHPIDLTPLDHRDCWLTPRRWYEIYGLLGPYCEQLSDFGFIAREARQLMEQKDITLRPVEAPLLKGSPERVKLVRILEEAADAACRALPESGLEVGTTTFDRWGVWVYLTRGGENFGGLAYSDSRAEVFLGLVDKYSKDNDTVLRLKGDRRLTDLRMRHRGAFYDTANLRVTCFGEHFFGLSGARQVQSIQEECRLYLDAIVEVLDAK